MLKFAEFAMRSRLHAAGVCVATGFLPLLGWLATVVVALVTLRTGAASGFQVLLWATLPGVVLLYMIGDAATLLPLIGAYLLALLLRRFESWEPTVIAAAVLAAVGALLLQEFSPQTLEVYGEVLTGLGMAAADAARLLPGLLGMGMGYGMLGMLVIARWCQGGLYNPGGFGKEFRSIRVSQAPSIVVIGLMAVSLVFPEQLGPWLALITLPLVFAGLGLFHFVAHARKLSGGWMFVFYAAGLALFELALPMLTAMALVDSFFNVRTWFDRKKQS